MEQDLNQFIKKSHIRQVERFNEKLRGWNLFCNGNADEPAELYEDINTSFTLQNVRVENGCLKFLYDGVEESEIMVRQDGDTEEWYEEEGCDSIPEYIKFWSSCLGKAKRYFAMDSERLDKMSEGEIDDID